MHLGSAGSTPPLSPDDASHGIGAIPALPDAPGNVASTPEANGEATYPLFICYEPCVEGHAETGNLVPLAVPALDDATLDRLASSPEALLRLVNTALDDAHVAGSLESILVEATRIVATVKRFGEAVIPSCVDLQMRVAQRITEQARVAGPLLDQIRTLAVQSRVTAETAKLHTAALIDGVGDAIVDAVKTEPIQQAWTEAVTVASDINQRRKRWF